MADVRLLTTATLDTLTTTPNPTRVVAIARRPAQAWQPLLLRHGQRPIVVLDDPRHLGNIGAAIRVAAAADADALLVTGDADPWHHTAVRGAAGLQFAFPVDRIPDPVTALRASPRTIVALHPEGDLLLGHDPLPPDAILLFGSERDGLSPLLLACAHQQVRIPMRAGVSSLNLATSVAIALFSR